MTLDVATVPHKKGGVQAAIDYMQLRLNVRCLAVAQLRTEEKRMTIIEQRNQAVAETVDRVA
ncbi:MAG: hypothetical protein CM1200mP18_18080 [Gammaproteobacteria bacterium]|nr:MAG: hypothetical protein CM1200mP18_18080 [Gammaproteobacteria bacterium]